jgi:hypothetical protein
MSLGRKGFFARWQTIRLALVPVAMIAIRVPLLYAGGVTAYPKRGVVAILAIADLGCARHQLIGRGPP